MKELRQIDQKDIDDDKQGLTPKRWHKHTLFQEKEDEDDDEKGSLALRVVLMHQYKDSSKKRLITVGSKSNVNIR